MKFLKIAVLLFTVSLVVSAVSSAQDTSKVTSNKPRLPYPTLPVFPQFPGGKDSLAAFIKKNIHYPTAARKHHISGTVEVDFTVTANGVVKNPKVLKPLGYGCDEEAIRIVNLMPKWIPGRSGRKPTELDTHVNIPFGKQEQTTKKTNP